MILPPPPMYKTEEVAKAVIEAIGEFEKPVVIALMGSTLVEEARKTFQRANIPTYPFPERAASALGALARRAKHLTTEHTESKETQKRISVDFVNSVVNLDELLTTYGIQTVPIKLALRFSGLKSNASWVTGTFALVGVALFLYSRTSLTVTNWAPCP